MNINQGKGFLGDLQAETSALPVCPAVWLQNYLADSCLTTHPQSWAGPNLLGAFQKPLSLRNHRGAASFLLTFRLISHESLLISHKPFLIANKAFHLSQVSSPVP